MADERERDRRKDKPAAEPRDKPKQRPGEGFEHRPAPQGRKIVERERDEDER